jgi:hypothetical protein
MSNHQYNSEALTCRAQAREYRGRPEQALLLSLAKAFEELASEQRKQSQPSS